MDKETRFLYVKINYEERICLSLKDNAAEIAKLSALNKLLLKNNLILKPNDIERLITNNIGSIIGYLMYLLALPLLKRIKYHL